MPYFKFNGILVYSKTYGQNKPAVAVPVNETTLTIILNIDGIRYAIITRLVNFNIQGPSIFR